MRTLRMTAAFAALSTFAAFGSDPKWDGFATVDDLPDVRSADSVFALDARAWTQTESIQWLAHVPLGMLGFILFFK